MDLPLIHLHKGTEHLQETLSVQFSLSLGRFYMGKDLSTSSFWCSSDPTLSVSSSLRELELVFFREEDGTRPGTTVDYRIPAKYEQE